ncbi:MAG TPA: AraC family transcriptional regulator [Bordetella sp.]|nr:AraC family transcriptional regulator [Bordetella sp.]
MSRIDWLCQFLSMVGITGELRARCTYGAPWRLACPQPSVGEIPYYIMLEGRAILADPAMGTARELVAGDVLLSLHGPARVLHDGGGNKPGRTRGRQAPAGWMLGENNGQGERMDLLHGRLFVESPHDRLIHNYLPPDLVVRGADGPGALSASAHLAKLVELMRVESIGGSSGGHAIFNALSSVLFTLALRAAIESHQTPTGLLALAGSPRTAPSLSAMFTDPARTWNLPELAGLCGMSRATFIRHSQDKLGRSAFELLTDIRMGMAANELKKMGTATEAVADSVGYRSVAAFRRVFADRIGMTPAQWRRMARESC